MEKIINSKLQRLVKKELPPGTINKAYILDQLTVEYMGVLEGDFSINKYWYKFSETIDKNNFNTKLFIQIQVLNLSAGCKSEIFKRFNLSQFEVVKNSVLRMRSHFYNARLE